MAKLSFAVGSFGLNLILLIALTLLVLDCLINPSGLRDLRLLRRDRAQIEATRDRLQIENAARLETVGRLHSDDAYLQRLIHQELGFVRPDELIYRFAGGPGGAGADSDDSPQPYGAK
jgi:cell division protein FtsB